MAALPTRQEYVSRWSALHGGYDAGGSVLVAGWLRVVYACSRPFAVLGVPPDVVTLAGIAVSGLVLWPAAVGGHWVLVAVVLVVVSGLLDGLDGAVAVLSDRTTPWGRVLDSLADRCSDGLYLVALWVVGAPVAACVVGGAAAFALEYVRARAGAAGMSEIGVVTIAERPTRVIITAAFLLGAGIYVSDAARWAGVGAWTWSAVSVVGLVQLLVVVRRRLAADPAG